MQNNSLKELFVFPTTRGIREFYKNSSESLLPRAISISEFFTKCVIVPNRAKIDEIDKRILLHKAIENIELKKLGFAKSFLEFLEHSEFIFLFLDELDSEFVTLDEIKIEDIYAEFDEHIEILKKVRDAYIKLLDEYGFYDIAARFNYQINGSYLKNFKLIHFKASGYLTNMELEILNLVSKIVPMQIEIELNQYNKKMLQKLKKIGFNKLEFGTYLLKLPELDYIKKEEPKKIPTIEAHFFENRISQASFVFKKIYEFIESKIEPENIVVITPNEDFKEFLEVLDTNKNLNFAKGKKLKSTLFLEELLEEISSKREKNKQEETLYIPLYKILEANEKGLEPFDSFLKHFLELNKNWFSNKEKEILDELIFIFKQKKLLLNNLNLRDILYMFLQELKNTYIDDTNGGKITVLGVLECRDISFGGVIFVDFNDGVVPKPSEKELFLNSKIKEKVGLPTSKDREALQKYHYLSIINRAKKVAIACVKNDETEPSPFLYELNANIIDGETWSLNSAIFGANQRKYGWDEEIKLEIDLSKEIFSSSKFTTFLDCKRKFYFRYIKNLKEIEENKKATFSTILHDALKELYKQGAIKGVKHIEDYKNALKKILLEKCNTPRLIFEAELFLRNANEFFKKEIELIRYSLPTFFEEPFCVVIDDINFSGIIDRIDKRDDGYVIIDYKYKNNLKVDTQESLDDSSDFQMAIYYFGAESILKKYGLNDLIKTAYFYNIKKGELLEENLLNEKIKKLSKKIEDLKKGYFDFSKTEDFKKCYYCDYYIICQRF